MELPPVWEHHFLHAAQDERWKRSRFWSRLISAGLGIIIGLIACFSQSVAPYRFILPFLFGIFTYTCTTTLVKHLIEVLPYTRRNNMLTLICLSGQSPISLWLARAASQLCLLLRDMILIWPLIILVGFTGMIPLGKFIGMTLFSGLILLYFLSLTLAASANTTEDGLAYAALLGGMGLSSLIIPGIFWVLDGALASHRLGSDWFLLSPIYGYYRSLHLRPLDTVSLILTLTGMFGWTSIFLFIASKLQHRREHLSPKGFLNRLEQQFKRFTGWESYVTDPTPFQKLAWREWKSALAVWALVISTIYTVLFLAFLKGFSWFKPVDFMLVALAILTLLNVLNSVSTGRLIAEARRENVLELVLTAGLKPVEILQGLRTGLLALYRRLYWLCCLVFTLLMIAGVMLHPFSTTALITYLIVWSWAYYALYRACHLPNSKTLWISLNLGRPPYSIAKLWLPSLGSLAYLGFHIYRARSIGYSLWSPFPFGTTTELAVMIFISLVGMLIYYYESSTYSEEMIAGNLAEVASYPVPDPSDERIVKWDRSKPFPALKEP